MLPTIFQKGKNLRLLIEQASAICSKWGLHVAVGRGREDEKHKQLVVMLLVRRLYLYRRCGSSKCKWFSAQRPSPDLPACTHAWICFIAIWSYWATQRRLAGRRRTANILLDDWTFSSPRISASSNITLKPCPEQTNWTERNCSPAANQLRDADARDQ